MLSSPRRRITTALLAVAILIVPVGVLAANEFTDVPNSHLFHGDIAWMADNAITSGCGDVNYCPDDNVTRGEMAAFMKRLATKKVVDAATAVTSENGAVAHAIFTRPDLDANGFTTFSSPFPGVYCLGLDPALGIDATNAVVQVSIEWGSSSGSDLFAFWERDHSDCPTDDIKIRTYRMTFNAGSVNGVASSDQVAFVVTVWKRPANAVILSTSSAPVAEFDHNKS